MGRRLTVDGDSGEGGEGKGRRGFEERGWKGSEYIGVWGGGRMEV